MKAVTQKSQGDDYRSEVLKRNKMGQLTDECKTMGFNTKKRRMHQITQDLMEFLEYPATYNAELVLREQCESLKRTIKQEE